ncbi:MAG: NAD(P)H-dependent oxidoreductase [Actinomycetota bacterium]|nr:NAD(P)H-dependent oxidoreductase [Actinomycetota bacterium]
MDLKAVLLNCTIKKSPAVSNTEALMDKVIEHLDALGVECEKVRVVDHNIPFGVASDEGPGDEWPPILDKLLAADIIIVGTPIWFGVRSSVCQTVIERLDGTYNTTNELGQYPLELRTASTTSPRMAMPKTLNSARPTSLVSMNG